MRQQRITTSQQEVYLIFLMDNVEFAASRIKDGDCCCCILFSSFCSLFYWELCVGNVLSFHVLFSSRSTHRWIEIRRKMERTHQDVKQYSGPEKDCWWVENGKDSLLPLIAWEFHADSHVKNYISSSWIMNLIFLSISGFFQLEKSVTNSCKET